MVLGLHGQLAEPSKRAFARSVADVYSLAWRNRSLPWRERRPRAAYRGACNPTVNPLAAYGFGRSALRGCGTLELRQISDKSAIHKRLLVMRAELVVLARGRRGYYNGRRECCHLLALESVRVIGVGDEIVR